MYVESWIIVVVLVLVIYLLYKVSVLSSRLKDAANMMDIYQGAKQDLEWNLCRILIYFDSTVVRKLPKKAQDKVLDEQAQELRCAFYNNQPRSYWVAGKEYKLEAEPMARLSNILGLPILSEDTENGVTYKDVNEDIRTAIDYAIDEFDKE